MSTAPPRRMRLRRICSTNASCLRHEKKPLSAAFFHALDKLSMGQNCLEFPISARLQVWFRRLHVADLYRAGLPPDAYAALLRFDFIVRAGLWNVRRPGPRPFPSPRGHKKHRNPKGFRCFLHEPRRPNPRHAFGLSVTESRQIQNSEIRQDNAKAQDIPRHAIEKHAAYFPGTSFP